MSKQWLPRLVLLADSKGDWPVYVEEIYRCFRTDFWDSMPAWPGKRVGLKKLPMSEGKVATFWHFISEGDIEAERTPDMRRCESIRWPRPTMESFVDRKPKDDDRIVWWKNQRRSEWRYLLALQDFSYLVVVADRGEYVLPWTQYHVQYENRRAKYRKEYKEYWAGK